MLIELICIKRNSNCNENNKHSSVEYTVYNVKLMNDYCIQFISFHFNVSPQSLSSRKMSEFYGNVTRLKGGLSDLE